MSFEGLGSTSVVVEFLEEDHATKLVSLGKAKFVTGYIDFVLKGEESKVSSSGYMPDACEEEVEAFAGPPKRSLEGVKETKAFLKECISLRTARPFKATVVAMQKVCQNLKLHHNIEVSVDECTLRNKRLNEQYRRNPRGTYSQYMAYLRGDSDEHPELEEVQTTMEHDIMAAAKAKFTKGAIMDGPATYSLIDVWFTLRHEYYNAHKDSRFYGKVCAQMVLRERYFSADQCKYQMNKLFDEFKEYTKALKRTGQGRPKEWEFYNPLRPILEGMVNVEPELTYSVGAAVGRTANRHLNDIDQPGPSSSSSSGGGGERYGKVRPPAKSSAEEKMKILKYMSESKEKTMEQLKSVAMLIGQFRADKG